MDRTRNFNSVTITRSVVISGNRIHKLYTFLTPKRLAYVQRTGFGMGVVDYSVDSSITAVYRTEPCGNPAAFLPITLAPIHGTTKALVSCKDNNFRLVDLTDGTEINNFPQTDPYNFGNFGLVLKEHRLSFVHGDKNTAESVAIVFDLRDEMPCHSSCGGCEYDASSKGCTSCSVREVLRQDGSCSTSCLSDEYVDANRKCQNCDPSCLTCSGPLTSQCSSCDQSTYKILNRRSSCESCSRETCSRCLDNSLCTQCLTTPTLARCLQSIGYTLSLRKEGDEKSGDIEIYLEIQPQSTSLTSGDLQFLIDYGFFRIETSHIANTGLARYDPRGELQEKGKISSNKTQTIEYLVYKAPEIPLSNKQFRLTVSLNNSVILYNQVGGSTQPSLIILNQTQTQEVQVLYIERIQIRKAEIDLFLNNSIGVVRIVGLITTVASTSLIANSIRAFIKFFQVVEVLIALSLINAQHGILIDNVIAFLRLFKFPIKLPSDIFWPKYQEAARKLFWKYRFSITKYEGEPFILCNEQLVVIFYMFFWFIWVLLVGIHKLDQGGEEIGGKKTEENSSKSEKGGFEVSRIRIAPYSLRRTINRERVKNTRDKLEIKRNEKIGGKDEEEEEEEKIQDELKIDEVPKVREKNQEKSQTGKIIAPNEIQKESKFEILINKVNGIRELMYLLGASISSSSPSTSSSTQTSQKSRSSSQTPR